MTAKGSECTASVTDKDERDPRSSLTVDLELKSGKAEISTGVGFFDHNCSTSWRGHSLIDNEDQRPSGRLQPSRPQHGRRMSASALSRQRRSAKLWATGGTASLRYASLDLAMDEALTRAAIDVSGRPYLV